jgi:glycosidase
VLDYVINHSAAQHPAFLNAVHGTQNPRRDWYVWQASRPTGWSIYGGDPWRWSASGYYFASFSETMPDFNLRNEDVLAWHEDNLRYWLNLGVDGFRFDAVGNLLENGATAWENQAENHEILDRMRRVIGQYDQRFLVCEAPSMPRAYAANTSCGHAFAFGYQYDLVSAVRGDMSALDRVIDYWQDAQGMVGFASNHDAFAGARIADQLSDNANQMRLLAATYLLQASSPFIYYGEEIGMRGAPTLQGDPALRVPMSWTADKGQAGNCERAKPRQRRGLFTQPVSASHCA